MTTIRANPLNDLAFDCLTSWRDNGLNIDTEIANMGELSTRFTLVWQRMQNPNYIHRYMQDEEDDPVSNVMSLLPPSYESTGVPPKYEDVPPPPYDIAIMSPPAYSF